ncbi:hypothetical protein ACFL35_18285 [Candidatus Riflebacteria bacterium]
MALLFAKAVSDKLDSVKIDIQSKHEKEIAKLTYEIKSLRVRLGTVQAQYKKKNIILEQRLERRKPATSFLDWIVKFLNSPILIVDRPIFFF